MKKNKSSKIYSEELNEIRGSLKELKSLIDKTYDLRDSHEVFEKSSSLADRFLDTPYKHDDKSQESSYIYLFFLLCIARKFPKTRSKALKKAVEIFALEEHHSDYYRLLLEILPDALEKNPRLIQEIFNLEKNVST